MNDWEDLVPQIAETFGGQMPYPETSEDIAAAYQRAPQTVLRMADQVAALYMDGTAQNPWGMLRYRAKTIPATEGQASRGTNREKAIARAEQRMRNELLHYDRWPEVEDELFGDRGTLRQHDNPTLRQRMEALWTELRPAGELVEAEAIERGLRNQEHRARLAAKKPADPQPGNIEVKDGITVEAA
jgi:hypothetical protein